MHRERGIHFRPMTKDEQEKKFWKHGDFGLVQDALETMQTICTPQKLVCNTTFQLSEIIPLILG
jgi:hypothetical protein